MEHVRFIRECHALAISAGKKGNHTFGALLAHDNEIILRAENTVNTAQDDFQHAEYNLVMKSKEAFSVDVLAASTLYTSTAPCFLCTATILAANIGRIVYSVSYETFAQLIPGGYKYISCGEIAERLGKDTQVIGPILEKEGLKVFQYWEGTYTPLDLILQRAQNG
jgi:tRNA(Arg) A34 adenosine deaminase TadA